MRGVVFDLDDTLYAEREYVRSGFDAIGRELAKAGAISERVIASFLWREFEEGIRGNSFNRLLSTYPPLRQKAGIEDLVRIYRSHFPSIRLFPGVSELLNNLKSEGKRIGLISDGFAESQDAKVRSLELSERFDRIILTGSWGRDFWKPHPRAYREIMESWNLEPGNLVYIADNPEKDFYAPRMLGWRTIRLRIPEQLRYSNEPSSPEYAAQAEVHSIDELKRILSVV